MQLHNSQAFYHHFAGRGHVLSQKAKPDTDPRRVLLKYVPTVHPWTHPPLGQNARQSRWLLIPLPRYAPSFRSDPFQMSLLLPMQSGQQFENRGSHQIQKEAECRDVSLPLLFSVAGLPFQDPK